MTRPAREIGTKPKLAWLPIDKLKVDHRYQRTIESKRSQARIEAITAGFRWSNFGVVTVTKCAPGTKGGGWAILDGQHRTAAAKRVGIAEIPCVITEAGSVAEQARIFISANRDRTIVNQFALHHALLAAGDPGAVQIDRVSKAGFVEIPRYPIPATLMKPGQTLAIGAIRKAIERHGEEAAIAALQVIVKAWPKQAGRLRGHLIQACAALVAEGGTGEVNRVEVMLRRLGGDAIEAGIHAKAGRGMKRADAALEILRKGPPDRKIASATIPVKNAVLRSVGQAADFKAKKTANQNTKPTASASDAAAIAAHIAAKGVTRCPTAFVAPTPSGGKADYVAPAKVETDLQQLSRIQNRRRLQIQQMKLKGRGAA